jgi:iron(III) transport system ATP-binding protein
MEGGNMIQIGTPHEIYEKPAAPAVAAFVGRCNFLTGKVVSVDGTRHTVLLDASGEVVRVDSERRVPTGDSVTVAVRPERLEVVASTETPAGMNRLDTQVITSSYVGSRYEYDVRLGDQVVQVLSGNGGLAGEVALVFDPGHALLYADKVELPEDQRDLLTVTP